MEHEHTPELRERRLYDPAVISADVWVCAECEASLDKPLKKRTYGDGSSNPHAARSWRRRRKRRRS